MSFIVQDSYYSLLYVRCITLFLPLSLCPLTLHSQLTLSLSLQRESNSVRVYAVHNLDTTSSTPGVFSRAIEVAQATLAPAVARQFLAKVLVKENARKILDGSKKWSDFELSVSNIYFYGNSLSLVFTGLKIDQILRCKSSKYDSRNELILN